MPSKKGKNIFGITGTGKTIDNSFQTNLYTNYQISSIDDNYIYLVSNTWNNNPKYRKIQRNTGITVIDVPSIKDNSWEIAYYGKEGVFLTQGAGQFWEKYNESGTLLLSVSGQSGLGDNSVINFTMHKNTLYGLRTDTKNQYMTYSLSTLNYISSGTTTISDFNNLYLISVNGYGFGINNIYSGYSLETQYVRRLDDILANTDKKYSVLMMLTTGLVNNIDKSTGVII